METGKSVYNGEMIRRISGTVLSVEPNAVVVDMHGMGLKVFMTRRGLGRVASLQNEVILFTHLHSREDSLDLYGFETEEELRLFELLISVSGVGPRSALAVLDVAEIKHLLAAIKEGRPDLLTQASGVGRKTAERIIIELRNKVESTESEGVVKKMDLDTDLVETLVSLGYPRDRVKGAIEKIGDIKGLQERLKEALKILGKKHFE